VIMPTFFTILFTLSEGGANASQTQDTAKGGGGDGFDGLATGSSRRQGFG
jgi:hypothetical protein